MNIGDIIKYRPWRIGDTPVEEVPENMRGWNATGIVYWIGELNFGPSSPEPAVEYLNQKGQMVSAAQKDVEVIS